MKVGSVVLYKSQVAVIAQISDGKLLLSSDDKNILGKRVREKDVFVLSDEASSLDAVLNAELPSVDFSVAYEFFSEETSFLEIAELFYGELKPEQTWKAWQNISNSPYFDATFPNAPIKVRSPEDVKTLEKKIIEKQAEANVYDEFIKDAKKLLKNSNIKGGTSTTQNKIDVKKYRKFLQEIEQVAFGKLNKLKTLVDLKVKQSAEAAHELLITLGFWTFQKNPYPTRFGLSTNDAKEKIEKPTWQKDFVDLTHFTSYAIDNPETNDPDDAVCFCNNVLYIHVALPAETITSESPADNEACDRGTTLYLPEVVAKMLNEKAIDYYALGLQKECYALTYAITFTDDYEINEVKIFRSKISVKRLTYEQADKLKNGELKDIFLLSKNLYQRRIKNGAIMIQMPEVSITVDRDTNKIRLEALKTFESSQMIREIMLITGEAGAFFAFKNQIPFQYISQAEPELPENLAEGLAGEYQKRKCMRPRSVSTQPSKHFALGLSMYAQLTSPLRRYVDLISQQQILNFIDQKRLIDRDEFLKRLARSEIGKANTSKASRLSRTHWILVYIAQNIEKTFDAALLEIIGNKGHVVLPELAYEADINLKKPHKLNDLIKLKAVKVDIPFQKVSFVEIF